MQCASTTSSTAAEKEAFKTVLEEVKAVFGAQLIAVCTDGHLGIAAWMRELIEHSDPDEPTVKHSLDIWHFIKVMYKHLTRSCTKKVSIPCHPVSAVL